MPSSAYPSGTIIPEDPLNEWFLEDWDEVMGNNERPTGSGMFSLPNSADALTIRVVGNKVRSALTKILGYATADAGPPYQLYRPEVPIQHPYFTWLWADSVAVDWIEPLGNSDFPTGVVAGQCYPKMPSDAEMGYGPDAYGRYGAANITVKFAPIYGNILADDDALWNNGLNVPGNPWSEWLRMTMFSQIDPRVDLISLEGSDERSSVYFSEASAGDGIPASTIGPPSVNPKSVPFQGSVFVYKQTTGYTLLWKCVPEVYTSCPAGTTLPYNYADPSMLLMPEPRRLLRQLGTTNSVAFPGTLGHNPGTLLFESLKGVRYNQPVRTDLQFGLPAWDYYMTFTKFDPRKTTSIVDYQGTGIAAGSQLHGWDCYPRRDSLGRYWYGATCGPYGTAGKTVAQGASTMIPKTNFFDLFRHVNDPAYPLPY